MVFRFYPALLRPLAAAATLLVSACAGGGSGSIPASTPLDLQTLLEPAATAKWPEPYQNGAQTGYNGLETTLTRSNVNGLTQLWSLPTGAQIESPVIVQNGKAYVNSNAGYVYAVNAAIGAQIWSFQTYEGSANGELIAGGHLVVPCLVGGDPQKNALCGVNLATGKLVWSYYVDCNCAPAAGVQAEAVASGNTVVFAYFNGSTQSAYELAVDARNGSRLWVGVTLPHGPSFNSAAIGGSQVFYGTGNGVCAASLSNGAQSWCTGVGSTPSISYSGGNVYVNTLNNGVYALNASTGAQIWQYTPTAGNYSGYTDPPAIAHGVVYVSGIGFTGNLYALKASTGAQIFNTSGDGSTADTNSSPAIANGVVYVGCSGAICAFNSSTGALLGTTGVGGSQYVTPSIVNGMVYGACGPNNACGYGLANSVKTR